VPTAIERVLVVDENEANTLFFQVLLRELGVTGIHASTNPEQALEIVEELNIQFVIAAWEMSNVPGTVFVQRAKAQRRRRRMPFLIFSKRLSEADVKIAGELGLGNVLSMPFDRAKASALIKGILDTEASMTPLETKLRKMEDLLEEGKPTEFLRLIGVDVSKKGPHLARFKTLLAECWIMVGKLDKAEKAVAEAIEADPNFSKAYYARSKILSVQGKHEEAIGILKTMMDSSPKNFSTILNLGSAYTEANQHDKAKETLQAISDLDPGNTEVKDELGKIAIKDGDLSLAAQLLHETQSGDQLARYFNGMGIAHVAKGEFDIGIRTYENALKILSSKGKTHLLYYNLGLALRKKGDLTRSFEMLCRSYLADGKFEKGYASLVRLSKEMKDAGMCLDSRLVRQVKEMRAKIIPVDVGESRDGKKAS